MKITDSFSTISLTLGIISFVVLGPVLSVPAIVCGHMSRKRIQSSNGQMKGAGIALSGMILGYINCFLAVAITLLYLSYN